MRPVTYENSPLLRRKVLPSAKMSFFKVKKSDTFHPKLIRNTSRSELIQGHDANIHCLAVKLSGWIPLFAKPLKVILSKRLVIINRVKLLNVNMMTNSLNIKQLVVCKVQGPAHHFSTFSKWVKIFQSVSGESPFYPDDVTFGLAYTTSGHFQEFDNVTGNFSTF